MARGRNQPPSTSNKPPVNVKNKTSSVAASDNDRIENLEEITLPQPPRNSRTTRRSLTIVKEQSIKDKGKIEMKNNSTTSRIRLRTRSQRSLQSSSDNSNISLININNDTTVVTNVIDTETAAGITTAAAQHTSIINGEDIFLDNINNVDNVVEISDFGQISNTFTEGGDSDEKQTINLDDSLGNFETGSFAMSSHEDDDDSQSQSDSILLDQRDEQEENSNNIIEGGGVVSSNTTDDTMVNQDHEILLEVCTDQSIQSINPSLYAFATPPRSIKLNEESSNELGFVDVSEKQKDSSGTPISNIKSSLRSRDTPTPDRAVSSPEIVHFRPNTKAPRTYQNKRKSTSTISTNNKTTTMHETCTTTADTIIHQVELKSTTKITDAQDKSNIIQEKVSNRQDTPINVTECRRSQRNRIIKYDVRDLLNKNRKSKIQIESKMVLKPPHRSAEPSPTYLIKDRSLEGYDTDRSSLMDSPRVFKGFSDSDNSKMSPITIKEKICTSDSISSSTNSDKITQKKEIGLQMMDSKVYMKEIGIELRSNKISNIKKNLKLGEPYKAGTQEIMFNKETIDEESSNVAEKTTTAKSTTSISTNLMENINVLDEFKQLPSKKNFRCRSKSVKSMPIRKLRNRNSQASITTTPPIELLNDESSNDEDIILESHQQDNLRKPTRTQEIFMKCLKRSQEVESLIERNISMPRAGRRNLGNFSRNRFSNKISSPAKPSSSVADFEKFVGNVINLTHDSSDDDTQSSNKEEIDDDKIRTTRSKRNEPLSTSTPESKSQACEEVNVKLQAPSGNKPKKKYIEKKIVAKSPVSEEVLAQFLVTSMNKSKKKSIGNTVEIKSPAFEKVVAKAQAQPVEIEAKRATCDNAVVKVQSMNKSKIKSIENKTEPSKEDKQQEIFEKSLEGDDQKNIPEESVFILQVEIKDKPILTKLNELTEDDSSREIISDTSVVSSNTAEDGLMLLIQQNLTEKTRLQKRKNESFHDDKSEKSKSDYKEPISPQSTVENLKEDRSDLPAIVNEMKKPLRIRSSQRKCVQKPEISLDKKKRSESDVDISNIEMEVAKLEHSSIAVSDTLDKSNISQGETDSEIFSIKVLEKRIKEIKDNSENKITSEIITKKKHENAVPGTSDLLSFSQQSTSQNLMEKSSEIAVKTISHEGNDKRKVTKKRIPQKKSGKEKDSSISITSELQEDIEIIDISESLESDSIMESVDNLLLQKRKISEDTKKLLVKVALPRTKSDRMQEKNVQGDKNESEPCERIDLSSEDNADNNKKEETSNIIEKDSKEDEIVTITDEIFKISSCSDRDNNKNVKKTRSLTMKERIVTSPTSSIAEAIDDDKGKGVDELNIDLENLKSSTYKIDKEIKAPNISESKLIHKISSKVEMDYLKSETECEINKSSVEGVMDHKKSDPKRETHKSPEISQSKSVENKTAKSEMDRKKSEPHYETRQSPNIFETKSIKKKPPKIEMEYKKSEAHKVSEAISEAKLTHVKSSSKSEIIANKVEEKDPECETFKSPEMTESKLMPEKSTSGEKVDRNLKKNDFGNETNKSFEICESKMQKKSRKDETDHTESELKCETLTNEIFDSKLSNKKSKNVVIDDPKESVSERDIFKSPKTADSKLIRKSTRGEMLDQKVQISESEHETSIGLEIDSKLLHKKSTKDVTDLKKSDSECEANQSVEYVEVKPIRKKSPKGEKDRKSSWSESESHKSSKIHETKNIRKSTRGDGVHKEDKKIEAECQTIKAPEIVEAKFIEKGKTDQKRGESECETLKCNTKFREIKFTRKSARGDVVDKKHNKIESEYETSFENTETKLMEKTASKSDHKKSEHESDIHRSHKIDESKKVRKSAKGEVVDKKIEKIDLEIDTVQSLDIADIAEIKFIQGKSPKCEIQPKTSESESESVKSPKFNESKLLRRSPKGELIDKNAEISESKSETRKNFEIVECIEIPDNSAKCERDEKKTEPKCEIAESPKFIHRKSFKGEVDHKKIGPECDILKSPKLIRKSTRSEMIDEKIEINQLLREPPRTPEIDSKLTQKKSSKSVTDHKKNYTVSETIKTPEAMESKSTHKLTTNSDEVINQNIEKTESVCQTRKIAAQKCLDFLKTLENDKILETKKEETKKRKLLNESSYKCDETDDNPSKKRSRKSPRTTDKGDSRKAKESNRKSDHAEEIMEIIVGEYTRKISDSDEPSSENNVEASELQQNTDTTKSDVGYINLEENCNQISKETDQNTDNKKISSQTAAESSTKTIEVVASSTKAEEMLTSKTDEIGESAENVINYSKIEGIGKKEDLKSLTSSVVEESEKKTTHGDKRNFCWSNIDDVTLTDQDFHHLRAIFKSKDLISNHEGEASGSHNLVVPQLNVVPSGEHVLDCNNQLIDDKIMKPMSESFVKGQDLQTQNCSEPMKQQDEMCSLESSLVFSVTTETALDGAPESEIFTGKSAENSLEYKSMKNDKIEIQTNEKSEIEKQQKQENLSKKSDELGKNFEDSQNSLPKNLNESQKPSISSDVSSSNVCQINEKSDHNLIETIVTKDADATVIATSKPLSKQSSDKIKNKQTTSRKSEKDFEKISSKEEKERILHSLYCPQKTNVRDIPKYAMAHIEKTNESENNKKSTKSNKQQIISKDESFSSSKNTKNKISNMPTTAWSRKGEDERMIIIKDKKESDKRCSGKFDRTAENEKKDSSHKNLPIRSKYTERDSNKWKSGEESFDRRNKDAYVKKDQRCVKINKEKPKESSRDHDSRGFSSIRDSKSDNISKNKFKDYPSRKDERICEDKKKETTPLREKESTKFSYKNYEHDRDSSRRSGRGPSLERKTKLSFDEALTRKNSFCSSSSSTKAEKASRFSLDSTKNVIENKDFRPSKDDKNSSFKAGKDGAEKFIKGGKMNLENNTSLESMPIKDSQLKSIKNDNSEMEKHKENENSSNKLIPSEEFKLKNENSTKSEVLDQKSKQQKSDKPKRSRWDLVKTVDQDENHQQKQPKLDTGNLIDYFFSKQIDNSQKSNDGDILNLEKEIKIDKHECKSSESTILENPTKSIGVLLSKAALKSYPTGFNLSASPYHTNVARLQNIIKPEISPGIHDASEDVKPEKLPDIHSTLEHEKSQIYADSNRSLPANDSNKEEETEIKELSVVDHIQKAAEQDKQPSPKEDSQDSQEDSSNSNNGNIRRSHRLKSISKIKLSVGRGLVRGKERFIDNDDRSQPYPYASSTDLEAENAKFLKDMEERLSQFQVIKENDYKCERIVSKEAKKMICDCFLTRGEEERGELGCGEDCLNRLLMIECGPKCIVGDRCTNKRFQKNLYAPCKVFRTEKKGFGIMADGDILQGEFIMEYVGEVLNDTQFKRRAELYSNDKNKHYYFMALQSDAIIDATAKGNISRFINHSCDPNAETQKWTVNGELRIGFFSRRKIYPGDEITFDYQFQRYGKEAQKCYCEAENCRGWIGEEPESEEDDEEISGESEEDEVEKEKSILTKDVEQTEQPDGNGVVIPVSSPLGVPATGTVVAIPPSFKHGKEMEQIESDALAAWISQEETPFRSTKAKKRKEFRVIKKKMEFLEDPDLEESIESLVRTGLKNQSHTLHLSRLMVRAKMLGTRVRLLNILRTGEMPCKRLFLDYHGLRLLHGWMNENEIKDIEKDLEVRLLIVQTLEVLPIPNKTLLQESKVYPTIESWANGKEAQSSSPNDDSPSDSGSATPIIIEEQHQKQQQQITKVNKTAMPESCHPIRTEIMEISRKLLNLWEELPEVFRIPKRERIEQMKEHEREANRQYKALNLVDEDNDRFNRKRRNERFGKASKSNGPKKFKWKKEKKGKELDKELDRSDIDPNLTKVQRRQLFAAKVEKDEQEKRERREFEDRCKFYCLDPAKTDPKDLPLCVNPVSGQWFAADKRKIKTPPSHSHIQVQQQPKQLSTNVGDYTLPKMDLPPLWRFAIDTKGRIYYYHMKIRIPQWEHPIKIEPLSGGTEEKPDEPVPSTSISTLEDSANPDDDLTSASNSSSDESIPESKMRKIDECSVNDPDPFETLRERKKRRQGLLIQERVISPRREEDRVYNQIEMRKYKENKEKIRKRREEMKRKKALQAQESKNVTTPTPSTTNPGKSPDDLPLPIQDYLFSSDEEEQLRSDGNSPLLLGKFVQGDKIVDELDALKKEKPLKRSLSTTATTSTTTTTTTTTPNTKSESKKRQKLDERKRVTENTTKDAKSSQKSSKHSNLKYLARKAKEKFRTDIAGVIVQHLTPYRKDTCQIGRITNNEDFKHLARKLTHFVMLKELKHCDSTGQILEVTESVKNKSREFIKKYMAKYGGTYIRPANDREFKDIPHKD